MRVALRQAAVGLLFLAPLVQAHSLWLNDLGQPSAAAREVIGWLTAADRDGLQPQDYDADFWSRALNHTIPPYAAELWDETLTHSVLRYLSDRRHGRLPPAHAGARYKSAAAPAPDLAVSLRQAVAAGQPIGALDDATPPWPQYGPLSQALVSYHKLVGHPAWHQELPRPPGGQLLPSQSWGGLPMLATRLELLGDLAAGHAITDDVYDDTLQQAVRSFQQRHALEPDGIVGRGTRGALAVTPAARARQIELVLERLRLTPLPQASRFIVVNLPGFMLHAYEQHGGQLDLAFDMRVIVGAARDTRTPLFDEDMRWIEFSPYWNIPLSIARRETLPSIESSPDFMKTQGMEFVGPDEQVTSEVTPEILEAVHAGRWRVRQRPGPRNSLGAVKFMLPNHHAIYLHDTPAARLFDRARRDFSHGCVRVEEPVALAHWVLGDNPDWTETRIRQSMGRKRPVVARLSEPMPVLMVYNTVMVRDDQVHFAPDFYGHDHQLEQALVKHTQAPSGPFLQ